MNQEVKSLLSQAVARLAATVDLPDLEAQLLLAYVLQKTRTWLLSWPEAPVDEEQRQRFESLVERRLSGEPVAHIVGEREFWKQHLEVTADTLIPRPETELIVETLLERFGNDTDIDLLDLGTGSGAIAIAISAERPRWKITATDISPEALQVAQRNALKHGSKINFHAGNWYEAIPAGTRFDVIVSNPPYIPNQDPHLNKGDVRFEPRSALASGKDGLDDIRRLISDSPEYLNRGGLLLLEHGFDQGAAVRSLMQQGGFNDITTLVDLAGQPRVTLGRNG